jgi:hypothetical protein
VQSNQNYVYKFNILKQKFNQNKPHRPACGPFAKPVAKANKFAGPGVAAIPAMINRKEA